MKLAKLMLMVFCLTGVLSFLTAQEPLPTGFDKYPECRLYYAQEAPREDGKILMLTPAQYAKHKEDFFKETLEKIDSMTSLASFDDKKAKIDTKQVAPDGVVYNMVSWSGVMQVKKAGTYTFLVTWGPKEGSKPVWHGIAFYVNEQKIVKTGSQNFQGTMDVDLKPGMTAIVKIVVYAADQNALSSSSPLIRYKLKKSKDYREITPALLYHQEEEEDW